jgi:hypothetical protein
LSIDDGGVFFAPDFTICKAGMKCTDLGGKIKRQKNPEMKNGGKLKKIGFDLDLFRVKLGLIGFVLALFFPRYQVSILL